jgi:hypothetical protein
LQGETYFRYQLFVSGAPLKEAAEADFLRFKGQVLFKGKNGIPAVQYERKTFSLTPLSTPVSFRWILPLTPYYIHKRYNELLKEAYRCIFLKL